MRLNINYIDDVTSRSGGSGSRKARFHQPVVAKKATVRWEGDVVLLGFAYRQPCRSRRSACLFKPHNNKNS